MSNKQENTPQYIKQVPWYAKNQQGVGASISNPTYETKAQKEDWYERGKKGFQATSFRKGACQNCGAMGHIRKECTERPRKVSVKFNNKNISADDIVKNIELGWQGKRDRWNGYESEMYKQVIQQYNEYQEIRKQRKVEEGMEDPDAEYKHTNDPLALANLPSQQPNKQKFLGLVGIRNREDMAAYLKDLSPNSATFDPKSRSLKTAEDPYSSAALKLQGEKYDLTEQDKFAFDQVEKNHAQLSSVGLPTLTEKIFKAVKQKNQSLNSGRLSDLSKRYGNQDEGDHRLQTIVEEEGYFQYPHSGTRRQTVKSSYVEDVLINDHTAVWGSWYNKLLGWGYSCCHANEKQTYCLGNKGKEKALAKELKTKAQKLKQQGQIQQKLQVVIQQQKGDEQEDKVVDDQKEAEE